MSASRNEARGLSGNQYFTWHALPRSQDRFSLPPEIRRLSGRIAAANPPATRHDVEPVTGGIAADHPPTHPLSMRGTVRAWGHQFPGSLPPLDRESSRSLLLIRCRQTGRAPGPNIGSPSRHFLNIHPPYACT